MNSMIQCKTTILLRLIAGVLACFAISPMAKAVVPAPDGGYPGGNTAEGQAALLSLTTGGFNTAVGFFSLRSDTTGQFNTAIGAGTLLANTGNKNTATGAGALLSNINGFLNTADGAFALFSNTPGIGNTANGEAALFNNGTGSGNTALGGTAGNNVTTANNVICIGSNVYGENVDNTCFIGNIFGQTSASGAAVYVNSNHRLGTLTSSSRFKDDIKPMERLSEALFALKPVTFHYKKEIDPAGMQQFGLVAEEVEKVNSALVVRDKEGKPYSVRYEQVNAMLLNEFLKEHKQVQTQQANIEQLKSNAAKQAANISSLKKEIEVLTVQLKTQGAQIQKVMAQQMKKITPHTVAER